MPGPSAPGAGSPQSPENPASPDSLTPGRRFALLPVALAVLLPLPYLGAVSSIYSDHADPLLTLMGALATAVITYGTMRLWPWSVSTLFLIVVASWFVLTTQLSPVGILLLTGLLTGAALSLCVNRRLREDHLLVVSAVLPVAVVVGLFAVAGLVHGFDPFARLATLGRHLVETSLQFMREIRFPYGPLTWEQTEAVSEQWERSGWLLKLMPANGATVLFVTLLIATRAIRRRFPLPGDRVPPFSAFAMGEVYVFPIIALCLIDAGAFVWEIAPLRLVADNALWILLNLYWVAGLAVCHGLMLQLRLSRLLRIWCWAVLIIFAHLPLAAVGLFDTWFKFRDLLARWLARVANNH